MVTPGYITIDMVRREVHDEKPEDNTIERDLFFSDADIISAMQRTADYYNAIDPPGVDYVSADCLPLNSGGFMDGICAYLYKMARHKLARNDMSWQTGGTTVELSSTRLKNFAQLQSESMETFVELAVARKRAKNIQMAVGFC